MHRKVGAIKHSTKWMIEKIIATSDFQNSRKEYLQGRKLERTFEAVKLGEVQTGTMLFGLRCIEEIKGAGEMLRKTSRLIAKHNSDESAGTIATKAPTTQRFPKACYCVLLRDCLTEKFSQDM